MRPSRSTCAYFLIDGSARAARHREVEALEMRRGRLPRPAHPGQRPRVAPLERLHQREQRRLRLARRSRCRRRGRRGSSALSVA